MTIDLLAIIGLAFSSSNPGKFNNGLCDCFFCVADIFSVIYSLPLRGLFEKANAISRLMIAEGWR